MTRRRTPVRGLFARNAGNTTSTQGRIKALAHRTLDLAKAGDSKAVARIDWALRALGDLE